jgi:hypothetical protein
VQKSKKKCEKVKKNENVKTVQNNVPKMCICVFFVPASRPTAGCCSRHHRHSQTGGLSGGEDAGRAVWSDSARTAGGASHARCSFRPFLSEKEINKKNIKKILFYF